MVPQDGEGQRKGVSLRCNVEKWCSEESRWRSAQSRCWQIGLGPKSGPTKPGALGTSSLRSLKPNPIVNVASLSTTSNASTEICPRSYQVTSAHIVSIVVALRGGGAAPGRSWQAHSDVYQLEAHVRLIASRHSLAHTGRHHCGKQLKSPVR